MNIYPTQQTQLKNALKILHKTTLNLNQLLEINHWEYLNIPSINGNVIINKMFCDNLNNLMTVLSYLVDNEDTVTHTNKKIKKQEEIMNINTTSDIILVTVDINTEEQKQINESILIINQIVLLITKCLKAYHLKHFKILTANDNLIIDKSFCENILYNTEALSMFANSKLITAHRDDKLCNTTK